MSVFRRRLIIGNGLLPKINPCVFVTNTKNQAVKLVNDLSKVNRIWDDNGHIIEINNYIFEDIGEHRIFIEPSSSLSDFSLMFYGCSSLQSIPENLFANNPNVTNLNSCFNGCSSLQSIPEYLFTNNLNVTDFNRCFYGCTALTGETPKDADGGELWERAGKDGYPTSIDGENCFYGCTKLSNYSEIPEDWK